MTWGVADRRIARLHLVTDDAILNDPTFLATARQLLHALGDDVLLHLRGRDTSASVFISLIKQLDPTRLIVNDRVDVAMVSKVAGVQLGARTLTIRDAKRLLGSARICGYSAHSRAAAEEAIEAGADFVLLGNVFETASHPGQPAKGLDLFTPYASTPYASTPQRPYASTPQRPFAPAPLLAIGGITAANAREVLAAGADGVAVISAVWGSARPVQAALELVKILNDQSRSER